MFMARLLFYKLSRDCVYMLRIYYSTSALAIKNINDTVETYKNELARAALATTMSFYFHNKRQIVFI